MDIFKRGRGYNRERLLNRLRNREEKMADVRKVEMAIGEWYLDADGCLTREVAHAERQD